MLEGEAPALGDRSSGRKSRGVSGLGDALPLAKFLGRGTPGTRPM